MYNNPIGVAFFKKFFLNEKKKNIIVCFYIPEKYNVFDCWQNATKCQINQRPRTAAGLK